MSYSIVRVLRNQENKCECGATCEKISFEVETNEGDIKTYGSECIKTLNIDTTMYELKRGFQTLKLEVVKYYPKNETYVAELKELVMITDNKEGDIKYKVVSSNVMVSHYDDNLHELSQDLKSFNYKCKVSSKLLKRSQAIQGLTSGYVIWESELTY